VSRYRFISAEHAQYPVALLCRVLGIARSGYYAWARRASTPRYGRAGPSAGGGVSPGSCAWLAW
jgi:hypothetical protein